MRRAVTTAAALSMALLAGCAEPPAQEFVVLDVEPVSGGKSSVRIEPEPTLGGDLRRGSGTHRLSYGATTCPLGYEGMYRGTLYCP